MRDEAVEEAERRKKAGAKTWGLELIKGEGDNRFVLYQLRHTTASDHLMNQGDATTVAELLGTSVRMLETTYGHLLDDHLAKAHEMLSGKRRGRGKGAVTSPGA
jgi:integrase